MQLARSFAGTTVILTTLGFFGVAAIAQTPAPSPAVGPPTPASDIARNEGNIGTQEAAKPAATPEPDFWHRETITGDWGGDRTRLKEKGVELIFQLSNFYQGTADGGVREVSVYNGKFLAGAKID